MKKLNINGQRIVEEVKKICKSEANESEKSTKIRTLFMQMKSKNRNFKRTNPFIKSSIYDIHSIGEHLLNTIQDELPYDIKISLIIPGELTEI